MSRFKIWHDFFLSVDWKKSVILSKSTDSGFCSTVIVQFLLHQTFQLLLKEAGCVTYQLAFMHVNIHLIIPHHSFGLPLIILITYQNCLAVLLHITFLFMLPSSYYFCIKDWRETDLYSCAVYWISGLLIYFYFLFFYCSTRTCWFALSACPFVFGSVLYYNSVMQMCHFFLHAYFDMFYMKRKNDKCESYKMAD